MELKRLTLIVCALLAYSSVYSPLTRAGTLYGQSPANTDNQGNNFVPYIGMSEYYNSNLFALENEQEAKSILGTTQTSDYITALTAGVKGVWNLGRQNFTGHAIITQSNYQTFSQLNNHATDILMQWNWQLGRNFSGDAGVTYTTQLYNLTFIQAPINDTFTSKMAYFDGYAKLTPRWQLIANTNHSSYDNNNALLTPYNLSTDAVGAGVRYFTPSGYKLDFTTRQTTGTYPNPPYFNGVPTVYNYTQNDTGVNFLWGNASKSLWYGNLDYTQHNTPTNSALNFSGFTGSIDYKLLTSGKTNIDIGIYRRLSAYDTTTTSYMLLNGISVMGVWNASNKLSFNMRARSESMNVPVAGGLYLAQTAIPIQTRFITAGVGMDYQVYRHTDIAANIDRGARAANIANFSYTYNDLMLSVTQKF